MPWQAIWFEHEARPGGQRSPEWFRGLVEPICYPYAHGFIEAESERLHKARDPGAVRRGGERFDVFYSLAHDGGQTSLDQQGCRILGWLFENFATEGRSELSAKFSEIPVVIHEPNEAKAAAMGNALTLLRFLAATEDQAIAKIVLIPWHARLGSAQLGAEDYERRVLEFVEGEKFYSDEVDVFDILDRRDLRSQRSLAPCCKTQIGFLGPLLEWVDDCWPKTAEARAELIAALRNSLADEARYWLARRKKVERATRPSRFV